MRAEVKAGTEAGMEVHVIHLGDTYYSGWSEEYDSRFLPYWPVNAGERVGSWALAGNHDMYSAGHGYFGRLLRDARFKMQSGSSWFSLYNTHWTILGLDSSYLDEGLTDAQVDLRKTLVSEGRRTILLTHHPCSSATAALVREITTVTQSGAIDAWFWGHEHYCQVFAPDHRLGPHAFASCVGHGGVPELVPFGNDEDRVWPDWTGLQVRWSPADGEPVGGLWRPFRGFAAVDLQQDGAGIRYVSETGATQMAFDI